MNPCGHIGFPLVAKAHGDPGVSFPICRGCIWKAKREGFLVELLDLSKVLEAGDVVQLKSGGLKMTVTSVVTGKVEYPRRWAEVGVSVVGLPADGMATAAWCTWMDTIGNIQTRPFSVKLLELVP